MFPDTMSDMKTSVQFKATALTPHDIAPSLLSEFIRFDAVTKRYPEANGGDLALHDLDLHLPSGGLTAIIGKSGSSERETGPYRRIAFKTLRKFRVLSLVLMTPIFPGSRGKINPSYFCIKNNS